MSVVNVQPDGLTVTVAAGASPGLLHVYNTGRPNPDDDATTYNQRIGGGAVTNHQINPGNTDSYPVNGVQYQIENYGDSVLQLLFGVVVNAEDAAGIKVSRQSRFSDG